MGPMRSGQATSSFATHSPDLVTPSMKIMASEYLWSKSADLVGKILVSSTR